VGALATQPQAAGRGQPLVEVSGLGKTYRGRLKSVTALAGVDLEVRAGDFVSVVGPSGCGKSTLLKILAGLIPKSSGSVRLSGAEVDGPSRSVGVMFQTPVLFAWRTVLDNILLPIEIFKLDKRQYADRAKELIAMVGLEGFAESYPRELSGGMQQRVALCRLLVYQPEILLMDEPFGALDEFTRESLDLELQSLWSSQGLTVVFVTHHLSEAVLLSDRVAVMSGSPSRISDVVEIDLPRPRQVEMMKTPRYSELLFTVRGGLDLS